VEMRDVVQRIRRLTNPGAPVEISALPLQAFEPMRFADVAATHALTGWRPRVSLDAGLARTVAHLRQAAETAALPPTPAV